jgi:hypothetical protein
MRLRGLIDVLTAVPRLFTRVRTNLNVADIERECLKIDEVQHNLDSAILQVEARLLHQT